MKEVETVRGCRRRGWNYGNLTRKFEGKRPFGRPRSRWDNNIKIGDKEIVSYKWWAVVSKVTKRRFT